MCMNINATELARSLQILRSDMVDEVVVMNIVDGSCFGLKGLSARV